ncbi:MAG: glycosyltransferase family 4 protein [Novosphingobium sp.]|nr:glycosyltransferase family 4 protein [Novosphingobium sp.]
MSPILIIASYAPSLMNFRGPLIKRLLKEGYRVHVACPLLNDEPRTRQWLASRGVAAHEIPLSRTGLDPLTDLRTLFTLGRLMRKLRPEVSIAYTIKPVIWGTLAAAWAGVPRRVALITGLGYAFTGKGSAKRRLAQIIARTLYRLALKRATLAFFQNPDDLADFAAWHILPAALPVQIVNGSGVDTAFYAPAPLPGGRLRFLLIARLLGDKGIREYVAAASKIRALGRNAEFHLVGGLDTNPDAIPADEVNGWVRDGIITWHGSAIDVRPHIAAAHVYVLPSYREGTPRTVLEAMAMGRPAITTDAPGCRETVIDGQNGFLVPIRDVEALTEAMLRFLDDPALVGRMGAQARRIAVDKYDVEKVNQSMMDAIGI